MSTAVKDTVYFYAMANNAAPTAVTRRSQGSNRAFKTAEDMRLPTHYHLKSLIVFIATSFTLCHSHDSFLLEDGLHTLQEVFRLALCLRVHLTCPWEGKKHIS
jgi:hypothetical protein